MRHHRSEFLSAWFEVAGLLMACVLAAAVPGILLHFVWTLIEPVVAALR